MSDRDREPNASRPEAEIIPPGANPERWQEQRDRQRPFPGQGRVWVWSNDPRYRGLRYGRPGPLGMLAIFAAVAALGALGFFVFLGAVAITLPLIVALVIVGVIGGIVRRL